MKGGAASPRRTPTNFSLGVDERNNASLKMKILGASARVGIICNFDFNELGLFAILISTN